MTKIQTLILVFISGIAADRLFSLRSVQAQGGQPGAGHPSLAIGSISVSVGMPRPELERIVADAGYRVGKGDIGFINTGTVNNLQLLGTVSFRDNIVVEVSRDWGNRQRGTAVEDLWRAFWGAITTALPDSKEFSAISIRAYTTKAPEGAWERIEFHLNPHHSISIERSDLDVSLVPGLGGAPPGKVSSINVAETIY